MSGDNYSIEIKIAGSLSDSFKSSLREAQDILSMLGKTARASSSNIKAAAKDVGASGSNIKAAARDIETGNRAMEEMSEEADEGADSVSGLGDSADGARKKFGRFNSVIKGAKSGISGFAKVSGKIGAGIMKGTAAGIGAAATAAVGLGTAAVGVGKEFESAMSQVAATKLLDTSTKKGQAQFQALEDAARECGATTAFSATEAAQALNNLAMAGYDTDKSVAALPTTLNLAGAGALSLEQSASILTAGMASLGIEQTEKGFSHFADILAITASKAKTDVAGIGEAITTVGKTAANLKGGTEEVAASLGILADVDLTGSEGGTHLRNMIMSLQNPRNKNAANMFKELGLSAYDSEGKMRGLNEIFGDLNTSMAGMTDQEKNSILSTIFKQTDIAAASAMLENCGDRFDELYDAAQNSSKGMGASAEMYAKQMDNLDGDIDILKSSLSDLGISFYKDTGGPLRDVTQAASSMVTQLNDAYKSGGLSAMFAEVGDCMAQIVNGAAKYAPMVVNVGIDLIQSLVDGIVQNSGGIASAAGQVLTVFAEGLFQLVPQIALVGIDIIVELANSLIKQAPQLASSGEQAMAGFINGLMQRGPEIKTCMFGLIQTLTSNIAQEAPQMVSAAASLISGLVNGIAQMLPNLITAAVQIVSGLTNDIAQAAPQVANAALNLIQSLITGIVTNAPTLLIAAVQLVGNLISGIGQMLPQIAQMGIQLILGLVQGLLSSLPSILQIGTQAVVNLISGVIQALPLILQGALQLISTFIKGIIQNLPAIAKSAVTIIASLIGGLISAIPMIFDAVLSIPKTIIDAILTTDWLAVGWDLISSLAEGILDGIKGIGGSVMDAFRSWFGGDDSDEAEESAESTVSSYASGIQANADSVTGAASSLSSTAFSGMDFTAAANAGEQSAAAFQTGITDGMSGLTVDTSSIGLDSAALSADLGQAGTEGAAALADSFTAGSTGVTDAVNTLGTEVNTSFDTTWQEAGTETKAAMQAMDQTVSTTSQKMVSAIQSMAQSVVSTVQQMGSSIQSTLNGIDLAQSGTNMMKGLVNGIHFMRPQVESAARDIADAAANSVNNALQIHSPSRLMDKSGQFVDEGFAGGMLKNAGKVKSAAKAAMAQPVMDTGKGMQGFSAIQSIMGMLGSKNRVRSALDGVLSSSSTVNNSTVDNSSQSGPAFVYSPTYQINGNASKDDIEQADRDGQAEFERRMKAFLRKNGRTKFA